VWGGGGGGGGGVVSSREKQRKREGTCPSHSGKIGGQSRRREGLGENTVAGKNSGFRLSNYYPPEKKAKGQCHSTKELSVSLIRNPG